MKIISGLLRGAIIPTAKDTSYRPSTGRFKEALFSILTSGRFAQGLKGKIILDLFAGTGSLGFEAISRGAHHVTFVDIDPQHLQTAKSFAEKYQITEKVTFIKADATKRLVLPNRYDIIFMDPPYRKKMVEMALESLNSADVVGKDSLLVIEVGHKENVILPDWCQLIEERVYGASKMLLCIRQ